jgi:hypothetical protein
MDLVIGGKYDEGAPRGQIRPANSQKAGLDCCAAYSRGW